MRMISKGCAIRGNFFNNQIILSKNSKNIYTLLVKWDHPDLGQMGRERSIGRAGFANSALFSNFVASTQALDIWLFVGTDVLQCGRPALFWCATLAAQFTLLPPSPISSIHIILQ